MNKLIVFLLLPFSLMAQQNDCVIPKKTEFKNVYQDCGKAQGFYRIQFFSTRNVCTKQIPFEFYTETNDCLNRYYFDTAEHQLTYCEALHHLTEIKKTFPDAFPIKETKQRIVEIQNIDN